MRVCIEGLLGVGKSTLIGDMVSLGYGSCYERVIGGIGFQRQLGFLLERYRHWVDLPPSGAPVLYDRSIWSDKVFANVSYLFGEFDMDEARLYREVRAALLEGCDLPDLVIWLDAPLFTCTERIEKRGTDDEMGNISHLNMLRTCYQDMLDDMKKEGVRVIKIDASKDLDERGRKERAIMLDKRIKALPRKTPRKYARGARTTFQQL